MKILISGSNGQLGTDCTQVLRQSHDVVALSSKEMDITNLEVTKETISHFNPDFVVNCAAYNKVEACETEKALAWKINVDGTQKLAFSVYEYGGKLIHISTDYVFNGKKNLHEPYVENEEPCPISYYGKTKLEGELVVRKMSDHHIIVRTAWVYGIKGHNFLKTMLRLALSDPKRQIKVIHDQFGSPTWSYHLAQQIDKLIEINGQGIYHATSEGYCTWYEVAQYFLEKMGVKHNVVPCSTDEYPTPAVRPQNSILENKRLKEQGINLMPHWQDGIDLFVKRFRVALINEIEGKEQ